MCKNRKVGKEHSSCLLVSNLLKIFKIYFYNINHKNSVLLCSLMKIIKKIFNNIHFPMDVNPIIIFIFLINKYFHIFIEFLIVFFNFKKFLIFFKNYNYLYIFSQ